MSTNLATLQRMIVVVFKYLIPRGFQGWVLFPFVLLRERKLLKNPVFMNHERIHLRQQLELLVLPFFIWYGIEYIFRLIQYRNRYQAYLNISFEMEAYKNETAFDYLGQRRFFSFIKYF
ncbi:MAG: hypothetical protein ACK4RM_07095 [Flavobacterium sp.]